MSKAKKKWEIWLLKQRLIQKLFEWSNKIKLPGFAGMSLYGVLNFFIKSFKKSNYAIKSSAIAFKFFLAIFPALLFFVSLIPFVPIENFQANMLEEIKSIAPINIYNVIESTINDLINNKHHTALGLGLFLTLFYASNGVNMMLSVFNTSHQVALKMNPIRQRLIALGIFMLFSLFIIIALAALTIGEVLIYNIDYNNLQTISKFGFQLLKWIVMMISLMIGTAILYNLGNADFKSKSWFTPGTSFAALMVLMVSVLISFFFTNFSGYNELYGSIGTLMIIMIWLNAICYVLLLGFELHTLSQKQRGEWEKTMSV